MIYTLNGKVPVVYMGDEPRYLQYAHNLLNGYFSPRGQVDLWSGPGYPLLIAGFLKMGFNEIGLRLLNAFLQYASIVLLFKTLQHWVSNQKAFWFALAWAFYYVAYKEMLYIYTEPLTSFLIIAIAFSLSRAKQLTHFILPGLLLGYLALVKIMFGYVIAFCLLVGLCIYLFKKQKTVGQLTVTFLIAMLVTLPYLCYTYSITGRVFYWGNSGGMSLYWMSTPVEKEYGDWNDAQFRAYCDYDPNIPCNAALFAKNHQADYDAIYKFEGVARDDAFKQKAIENIKNHPLKYLKNIVANASRLFFGLPNSYQTLRIQNLFRILPNIFVFGMFIYCLIIGTMHFKKLPLIFYSFILLLLVYLGATLLVSAQQRQLYVVLPLILIWFAWLIEQRAQLVQPGT